MSTVIKRTEKGYLFGKYQTKDYTDNLKKLEEEKKKELEKYEALVTSGKIVYPNQKINNFEVKYLGNLITLQELYLRDTLQNLPDSNYTKSSIFPDLPMDITKLLIPINMRIMRFKRLFDIFFQAATIKETERSWLDNLKNSFGIARGKFLQFDLQSTKELRERWNLPTPEQLNTIINNSMDTRVCLAIILGRNNLNKRGLEKEFWIPYRPDESGNILLGDNYKLNKEGKIVLTSYADDHILSGIKVETISSSLSENRTENATFSKKEGLDFVLDFLSDRNPFASTEQLPKEGMHWPLIWNDVDNDARDFHLMFKIKEAETKGILYGKYSQKQRILNKKVLKGGNRTQKNKK